MLELFKVSLLLTYLLFLMFLVAAIMLSGTSREFLFKIHRSSTDDYSWTRYSGSVILLVALGIAVYQAAYSDINIGAVSLLVGIAITGKVVQTSINKDK
jgi:hypothetical protein